MSYPFPQTINSSVPANAPPIFPPGCEESGVYLRHLLDQVERDLIMPIILSSKEAMPFEDRLKKIVGSYNEDLPHQKDRIDFGDSSTRWAYVYVFMMRHSHLVHSALMEMRGRTFNFSLWQHIHTFNVCAIGGGPGIDILGFALFLKTLGICRDTHGTVIDRCGGWADTWTSLHERTQSDLGISQVDFVTCDLTSDPLPRRAIDGVRTAHLVTLTKVVSSLSAFVSNRPPHLRFPFLSAISPGTFVLFIDNEVGPHNNMFREAVMSLPGFRVIADYCSDMSFPKVSGPNPNTPFVSWLSFYPAKEGINRFIFLQKSS